MKVGGQRPAPVTLPPGRTPGTHCTGRRVGPWAGLDGCGKFRPTGIRSPDCPAGSESLRYPGPQLQKEDTRIITEIILLAVYYFNFRRINV